ncbi:MAG: hypothetical protein ACKO1O_11475 [Erythrobacter sp.]
MNVRPVHFLMGLMVASSALAAPVFAPDAGAWLKSSGYPKIAGTSDKTKVTFGFAQLGGSKTDCAVRTGYAYVLVSQRRPSPACLLGSKSSACYEVKQEFDGSWTTGTPVCGGESKNVDVMLAVKDGDRVVSCQPGLDCSGEVSVNYNMASGRQVYHAVYFKTVGGIVKITDSQLGAATKPKS